MVRMGHTLSKADLLAIEGLTRAIAQALVIDARQLRLAVEQIHAVERGMPGIGRTGARALEVLERMEHHYLITAFASHGFIVLHQGGRRPYVAGDHSFMRREVFNYLSKRRWIEAEMPPNEQWSLLLTYTISKLGRLALQRYQAAEHARLRQEQLWHTPPVSTPVAEIHAISDLATAHSHPLDAPGV